MFEIGDNIVYPMHGAGVIKAIEEKEILGETQLYYVIQMLINKMQVMIPIRKMNHSSIRKVVDSIKLEAVLKLFNEEEATTQVGFKERFKINLEKMKAGEIEEGAEVIRDLTRLNKEKKLNSSEKQMLGNARKILISELGLINGMSEVQASDLLSNRMG